MARDPLMMYLAIAGIALSVYLYSLKTGTNVAADAGAWFARTYINPFILGATTNPVTVTATAQRGIIEGGGAYYLDTTHIPITPENYSPSNWTWTLPNGVSLGLPAGMTPAQFCKNNPYAPVCQPGAGVI